MNLMLSVGYQEDVVDVASTQGGIVKTGLS